MIDRLIENAEGTSLMLSVNKIEVVPSTNNHSVNFTQMTYTIQTEMHEIGDSKEPRRRFFSSSESVRYSPLAFGFERKDDTSAAKMN